MRPARALAIVAFVTAAASSATVARAEDAREQSRAAFRRGVTAAERSDYASARAAFLEAYRLFPHPSILLNLGIARWKVHEYVEAEEDLAKFLADDGGASADEVASARAALAVVRDHLGTLRVSVAPASARATLDKKPIALVAGGAVALRAVEGDHAVHVEAEGYEPLDDVVHVAPGGDAPLVVALRPAPPAPHEAMLGKASRVDVGIPLVGVAGLAALCGTYAGIRALTLASEYRDPTNGRYQDPSTKSQGTTLRTAADALFAGALVLGGIGAWLLLTPEKSDAKAGLVVGPAFVGAGGAF
jgi:hypothetical protein